MSERDESGDGESARLVLSTAPDLETAQRIARALVQSGLAACVNLAPGLTSIYRWKGKLEEAGEVLMVIKTTAARVTALERELARLHPYELPEFVVIEPRHVEAKYLAWLRAETARRADE